MALRRFQRSLIGGEISPKLGGQIDLAYYQNGVKRLVNMLPEPVGTATARNGFRFVRQAKTRARVIEFRYGSTDNAMLEFGDGYVRVHTLAGTLLHGVASPFKAGINFLPAAVNTGSNRITLAAHGFSPSDPVRLSTDNTLPSGVTFAVTYYVKVIDPNTIELSATPGGTTIALITQGLGNHRISRFYDAGDLVTFGGSTYWSKQPNPPGNVTETAPGVNAFWHLQPATGELEIFTEYTAAQIASLDFAQSFDVLSVAHPSHPLRELRRYSATRWAFVAVPTTPSLATPTGVTAVASYGQQIYCYVNATPAGSNPAVFTTGDVPTGTTPAPELSLGDYQCVRLFPASGADVATIPPGYYLLFNTAAGGTTFSVMSAGTARVKGATIYGGAPGSGDLRNWGYITPVSLPTDFIERYVVTAVSADGIESAPSAEVTADNDLSQDGNYNTIAWSAVAGAATYRVYRKALGVFAFLTETSDLSFKDDNTTDPDGSRTAPKLDATLVANNPGTVGYYERRRVVAGFANLPQTVLTSRTDTEADWSYHIPVQDSDRLSFRLGSREACQIQYVLPLAQLVLLTDSTEFRVTPLNDDALTPSSISVRPQSYVGAAKVRPLVAAGTALFVSSRGYHVRELGWNDAAASYTTGDLSLRASHLFDGYSILDAAFLRAPWPIAMFVSSTGKLLSLTYVPEERVGAWAQHTTDGKFVSVASTREADGDHLWACVERVVNGATVYYVERQEPLRELALARDARRTDSHLLYDGRNTSSTTISFAWGGSVPVPGGNPGALYFSAIITASAATFSAGDVGKSVIYYDPTNGFPYEFEIATFTSSTSVVAFVKGSWGPANAYAGVATTAWAIASKTFTAAHLKGKTITALGDGVTYSNLVVDASTGAFSISKAAVIVCAGLPVVSEVELLPPTLQIPSEGVGVVKAIDEVHVRVVSSSVFQIGPDAANLIRIDPATALEPPPFSFTKPSVPTGVSTCEVAATIVPKWSAEGSLLLRQPDPLPFAVTGVGIEVAVGD